MQVKSEFLQLLLKNEQTSQASVSEAFRGIFLPSPKLRPQKNVTVYYRKRVFLPWCFGFFCHFQSLIQSSASRKAQKKKKKKVRSLLWKKEHTHVVHSLFSSIKHKMRSSIEWNKKKHVLSYYKVVDLNFCTDDLHPCKKLGSTENFSNFLVCFPHHYYMASDNGTWHAGSMD